MGLFNNKNYIADNAVDPLNELIELLPALRTVTGSADTSIARAGDRGSLQTLSAPSRGLNTPKLKSTQPIAHIESTTGVAIGYYNIGVYRRDVLLNDPTVPMDAAKLGVGDRSKIEVAYGYSWDEVDATENLLSAGQVFRCERVGTHTDGKAVYELLGNPIGIECPDDDEDDSGGEPPP